MYIYAIPFLSFPFQKMDKHWGIGVLPVLIHLGLSKYIAGGNMSFYVVKPDHNKLEKIPMLTRTSDYG